MKKNISVFGCGWLGEPLAVSLIQKSFSVNGSTTSEPKIPVLASKGINPFLLNLENISSHINSFLISDMSLLRLNIQSTRRFVLFLRIITKEEERK